MAALAAASTAMRMRNSLREVSVLLGEGLELVVDRRVHGVAEHVGARDARPVLLGELCGARFRVSGEP